MKKLLIIAAILLAKEKVNAQYDIYNFEKRRELQYDTIDIGVQNYNNPNNTNEVFKGKLYQVIFRYKVGINGQTYLSENTYHVSYLTEDKKLLTTSGYFLETFEK